MSNAIHYRNQKSIHTKAKKSIDVLGEQGYLKILALIIKLIIAINMIVLCTYGEGPITSHLPYLVGTLIFLLKLPKIFFRFLYKSMAPYKLVKGRQGPLYKHKLPPAKKR